jgi:hypothetical protein
LLYDTLCRHGEGVLESAADIKELSEIVFRSAGTAYVVVDGLDECDAAERKKILTWLTTAVAAVNSNHNEGALRVLFISQALNDICKQLGKAEVVTLTPQDNSRDIRAYVTFWAGQVREKFRLKEQAVAEMIEAVSGKANGEPSPFLFLALSMVLRNWRLSFVRNAETSHSLIVTRMFLYAKLVMQNLMHQVNLVGLRKELRQDTLPEGIDQA